MIPVEELRTRVGLAADDTSQDALLESLEIAAVATAERETGRHFGPVDDLENVFDGGGRSLWLTSDPNPAGAVTGVDKWDRDSASWVALDATAYRVMGRQVVRIDESQWQRGYSLWRVRFPAGYAEGEEPPEIREAVIATVKGGYQQASAPQGGLFQSEKIDDYSYTLSDASKSAVIGDGRTASQVFAAWSTHAWIG